jgi:transposase
MAFLDQETGECGERQLHHSDGEAEKFYRELQQRGVSVRVGMEATGHSRWFEQLLAELGFEVWIGDAAEIKRQRVRKQKTDREDARLVLKLLLEIAFLESGYRVRRIVICGNCFGTGIGWCRCARES